MTTEQTESNISRQWGNTVHFGDKALEIMANTPGQSITFTTGFHDDYVCTVGGIVADGICLQDALDACLKEIDRRNKSYKDCNCKDSC